MRPIDGNGHVPDTGLGDYQPDTIEYWKARSRQHEHIVRAMRREQAAARPGRLLEILAEAQELACQLAESLGVSREEMDQRAAGIRRTA